MSLRQCQREVSSREFAEWLAFYALDAEEQDPDRPPSREELGRKLEAWAAAAGGPR